MQRKGINKLSKFSLHAAVDWAKSCRNTIFIWMGSTILLGRKWGFMVMKDHEIQEQLLEEWKLMNPDATEEEIKAEREQIQSEHPSDYSDKVRETLVNIVNKYLPVNVKYFEPEDSSVVFEQTTAVIYIVYA